MNSPKSDFFSDLQFRNLVKQVTDDTLGTVLNRESLTLYCGFDPTSDSLHVGSLLPLVTLRRFQLAGHKPIAVIGGATGMIGDPSGKTAERSLQDDESLARNVAGLRRLISRLLPESGPSPAQIVNNAEWTKDMSFLLFLRDIGKHFTINHMMAKESVRARLEDREHGISYTEFSYMLLQAYDFLHLNQKLGCQLQLGGSDQWGNITAGTDLIRKIKGPHVGVFGMTHPLVMKADGGKFGKTESGTIWLDAHKTSPYQFYQYFIQTPDADVGTYLRYFTFLSKDEILALEEETKTTPEKRSAQIRLAREVTQLVHGAEELARVEKASHALFGASIRELDERTLLDVLSGAPHSARPKDALSSGVPLIDLLVDAALVSSKGAARKDITAGGIYLNNERVNDPAFMVRSEQLICGGYLVLRKGKKNYHLVSFK
ncbi:MAG TPA: tyrosine--tRNA ligase [Bdellovibrionales bacterium]|nr:tyrosine--tRNA ligase [Bdellovibrionales bacterium]